MTRDQFVLLALGALTLVCVLLVVALVRLRATDVPGSPRSCAELRDRLDRARAAGPATCPQPPP